MQFFRGAQLYFPNHQIYILYMHLDINEIVNNLRAVNTA